ncbi:TnsD family Tn7-like transposition protein [Moritella sp. Urea-trap-13]|uniref:TnsD family Tn7-like transposition protein n=1 Tax=Moritella sp. Urea-trap-13 TaxID=2058327 RepID=UPI000C336994|nr:TnsD family Tn7-like transposition protein [Moritella sp. Urea-trap-13]PKH04766.1 hypothetical protein CXF93_21360 [Moritella sp. Urea-trap-13]
MNKINLAQYCPKLFIDETLHSWLIRWAYESPYPSVGELLKHLLGTRNKQLDSIFPSYIENLVYQSSMSEDQLITAHTVVPYFSHFCGEKLYQEILQDMHRGDTQAIYSKMSLTASRINTTSYLNYCPRCVEEDVEQYGIAYWHVSHQIPGVLSCVKHKLQLKGLHKLRRGMIKPPQYVVKYDFIDASSEALKLARLSLKILSRKKPLFEGYRMSLIYRTRLREMGMASTSFNVHQTELRAALEEYWQPILTDETIAIIFDLGDKRTYPACMFYHSAAHHHPLKHILMIGMLFHSIEELLEFNYDLVNTYIAIANPALKESYKPQEVKLALKELKAGCSLRHSSKISGLSVAKVKQIAISNGIEIKRREQSIFEKDRNLIIEKLSEGFSTTAISEFMHLSIPAVEQILSQHPEIVVRRKELRFLHSRSLHRANLIQALKRNSTGTRHDLQKEARNSYTWLFRYDQKWLYGKLPERQDYKYWPRKTKGTHDDNE